MSTPAVFLRLRPVLMMLALALVYAALAWACIDVSRGGGKIAAIWLPCATAAAAGLNWRVPVIRITLPCFTAHMALLLTLGRDPSDTFFFSLANAVEIAIVLLLARRIVPTPAHVREPRLLFQLVAIAILAAMASSLIGALTIASAVPEFLIVWGQWWLAHVMAMMTFVPILLIIEAERQDARRRGIPLVSGQAVIDVAIGAVIVTSIFVQSSYPLLFLAAPVILAVASRQGSPASAVLLLVTTVVATYLTMEGYGPINLVSASIHTKAALLQIFVFATFASTLPITLVNERLATLRERTITLIETMNEIPFSTDLNGRWIYISSHWTKLFGEGRIPSLRVRALAFVPPERRRAVMRAMSSLKKGDVEEAHFEFQAHAPSASPIHLRVRVRLLRKRDGSPDGFGGIITDVSRETESQQALATSELRLISLAENAPVGIFQFDNEGNATFLNKQWARMHGMSVAEGLGKGWQRILNDEQRERYATFARERAAGATTDVEVIVQRPDGTQCWARAVTTALRNPSGEIIGRMGVVVDQTMEHEAKAALMAAVEEAKSAAMAKDRFLALMSHELRTPMNGVLGFAERLQDTELSDSQRRYVSLITRSGEIMLGLLNDILDTSRMREGQMQLAREPFDLFATLTGTCQHFEALAARRGIQLRCNFASPLPKTVIGDQQRLMQILNNLIGNALKFTEEGWISVYARIEMQYERTILFVEVTDTGIGIAPDATDRVFEAFDQGADDISMRFGGTGLGLPIARGLAEQMGGSLRLIKSDVGKGSIFRLTLPLELQAQKAPSPAKPAENQVWDNVPATARKLNILIAEDNEINQELIIEILADRDNNITMVADGQEAVEAVERAMEERRPFDLVFMDVRMPVLDGIGATKAIRARGIDAAVLPIIAVTASAHQDAMDACWQAGMQDYVTKPLSRNAIELVLDRWGGKGAQTEERPSDIRPQPMLDPNLAPLLPRFVDQCRDTVAAITKALEKWPETDAETLGLVQNKAHSLAGLAATFAAPQLVPAAQAVDLAIDGDGPERTRQLLLDLQETLRTYLSGVK